MILGIVLDCCFLALSQEAKENLAKLISDAHEKMSDGSLVELIVDGPSLQQILGNFLLWTTELVLYKRTQTVDDNIIWLHLNNQTLS